MQVICWMMGHGFNNIRTCVLHIVVKIIHINHFQERLFIYKTLYQNNIRLSAWLLDIIQKNKHSLMFLICLDMKTDILIFME